MNRAYVESLLVGVPLPATKSELLSYARHQDGGERVAAVLERIPDREYRALQEVGEELDPKQPVAWKQPSPTRIPKPESGVVPGGPAYTGGRVDPPTLTAEPGS